MPYTQCLEREVEADCKNEFCFRPFTLETKELIESYTKPWQMDCSDLSFANLFIWGTEGKMEFAEKNNVLYVKLDFEGVPVYFWAPIPKKGVDVDYRKAIMDAADYMKQVGVEPTFRSVWTPFRDMMLKACPEMFAMPTDIAWDYVYERESLATLKGKKLHGKRNHINKFLANHPDYEYRKLDATLIDDCMALYDKWISEREETKELEDERKSVSLALHNMERLGLTGGSIFVDGKMGAFTVGERLRDDVQLVHIEKADTDIDGLYPMINQQYVLHECQDVTYVNREEDMGHAGMRKAKRSYNPAYMVEKYLLSFRDLSEEKGLWGAESEDAE